VVCATDRDLVRTTGRRRRDELTRQRRADAVGHGFRALTLGAEDEVDAAERGHGDRELLRVFDEVGQTDQLVGSRPMSRSTNVAG
jgi:hypothetical protein